MAGRLNVSEARRDFSALVERAGRGDWQVIGRRGQAEVVLADGRELDELLSRCYPFAPEVSFEDENVGIYLLELAVHGVGTSLPEAQADLMDAATAYVAEWVEWLHAAPDHRDRAGWVRRVQLAGDDPAALGRTLFGDAYQPLATQ